MAAVPLLLALLVAPAAALEFDRVYGASSFKFLKLPLSPRIVALGGAGAGLADGAGELDLNPAAPALDSARLVVGKGLPFAAFEAGTSHIVWSVPYRRSYRILINARYLGFDKIQGYEMTGPTTAYGAHTLKGQLGLAGTSSGLSWGFTANFAENAVADANYRTAMLNIGLRYRLMDGLGAGLSVINADFWGSESENAEFEDPFPPTAVQAGLAYSRPVGKAFRASVAADVRTRNDEKMAFPVGAEITWQDLITVRAGFPFAEPEPDFAAGLGLTWSRFGFQYAFQGHPDLGPGHYWALEVRY